MTEVMVLLRFLKEPDERAVDLVLKAAGWAGADQWATAVISDGDNRRNTDPEMLMRLRMVKLSSLVMTVDHNEKEGRTP